MLKGQKKHIDKEQDKGKHEAPRSVNYRAIQNENKIGTTALERSVICTTGGFKRLSLYKILNTKKIHKKLGSHNGFITQSVHLREISKSNRSL